MPFPILTPEEIAQVTKEAAKAQSAADTFASQLVSQQTRIDELELVDGVYKKQFDFYNDEIIGKYDLERRSLDGYYILNPVTETDILNTANLLGGRTAPALPATDLVRIAEFDGTPLVLDPINESQHITDQAYIEDVLQNGYGGMYSATLLTDSPLTPASTTLEVIDAVNPIALSPGDIFLVVAMGDLSVVQVDSIVLGPPNMASLGITLIVPPPGTIAAGSQIQAFLGFDNTERTNKIASDPDLQILMDYLLLQLEYFIDLRLDRLYDQIMFLNDNEDPYAITQIATTILNVQASIDFLTNYIIMTDISDTGLTGLAVQRALRVSQINIRVLQILNNYTNQVINFYDKRYSLANDRANTARGSLRLQKNAEQVKEQSQSYVVTLTDQVASLNSLLS